MTGRTVAGALSVFFLLLSLSGCDDAPPQFKFGILRQTSDGEYAMDVETTRIPKRVKDTGFRFGVAIDNPSGKMIEWYELVHLPARTQQLSGGFSEVSPTVLKTDIQHSDQEHIVDEFWFDEGDPVGPHRMEVYVNGVLRFEVGFEVIESR